MSATAYATGSKRVSRKGPSKRAPGKLLRLPIAKKAAVVAMSDSVPVKVSPRKAKPPTKAQLRARTAFLARAKAAKGGVPRTLVDSIKRSWRD